MGELPESAIEAAARMTDARPLAARVRVLAQRLACRFRDHRWLRFCDGLKRRCTRCGREEWVMENPHPLIGEPKYYWEHMAWPTPWPEARASASPTKAAARRDAATLHAAADALEGRDG